MIYPEVRRIRVENIPYFISKERCAIGRLMMALGVDNHAHRSGLFHFKKLGRMVGVIGFSVRDQTHLQGPVKYRPPVEISTDRQARPLSVETHLQRPGVDGNRVRVLGHRERGAHCFGRHAPAVFQRELSCGASGNVGLEGDQGPFDAAVVPCRQDIGLHCDGPVVRIQQAHVLDIADFSPGKR